MRSGLTFKDGDVQTVVDHLRVCGAVSSSYSCAVNSMGSSPRVRSGQGVHLELLDRVGIISACAERSAELAKIAVQLGDHLRVCGAVSCIFGIWSGWMVRNV